MNRLRCLWSGHEWDWRAQGIETFLVIDVACYRCGKTCRYWSPGEPLPQDAMRYRRRNTGAV